MWIYIKTWEPSQIFVSISFRFHLVFCRWPTLLVTSRSKQIFHIHYSMIYIDSISCIKNNNILDFLSYWASFQIKQSLSFSWSHLALKLTWPITYWDFRCIWYLFINYFSPPIRSFPAKHLSFDVTCISCMLYVVAKWSPTNTRTTNYEIDCKSYEASIWTGDTATTRHGHRARQNLKN